MDSFDPRALLSALSATAERPTPVHVRRLPARQPRNSSMPPWADPRLVQALGEHGVTSLWQHQREAADLLHDGTHCVLATGTASGKSVAFWLPALDAILRAGLRESTVLYLAPTKALAADQLAHLEQLALPGVRAAVYDGDTPAEERAWTRRHANVVLTNPDMLHHAILPGHAHWSRFMRGLGHVVIDECHTYRGVFGSHVAAVLRRLRRVATHHRARPVVAFASATVAQPGAHATRLLGEAVQVVDDDASPRPAMTVALLDGTPTDPCEKRRSTLTHCGELLADLVAADVQTTVFARSRLGVEVVAEVARESLSKHGPEAAQKVAAYRGGYLPEERRALEEALRTRRLTGLATTSALELGIDISGLDAVVLAGWPGTVASWWQRAGRAGRDGRDSLLLFVAEQDPLDTFLVHHPEAILDRCVEAPVLDPDNPHVLGPHLAAAAAEIPLTRNDEAVFGPAALPLLDVLTDRGLLRRRPTGWYWTRQERPSAHISLRGGGALVRIVEEGTGRVLGTVDGPRADSSVHQGAVYVHQGRPHLVTHLDLGEHVAHVVEGDPGWTTSARSVSAFDPIDEQRHGRHGPVTVSYGKVAVRNQVTSFRRRLPSGEIIGEYPLDLPERILHTTGVWWTFLPESLAAEGIADNDVPGALHAAEHAAIGMLPLLASADRWDIGGVSTQCHPLTGLPTILVYDGHPGGAGFARRGFAEANAWLDSTARAIEACPCELGCPSCVHSPKCGNGNEPLDKTGAALLLRFVLACAAKNVTQGAA